MPLKEIELEVGGYRDDRLTHLYRQQSQNSGKLGLFLPGVGYGIKFPALLYAASLFTDLD